MALPIWLADELWEDEGMVIEDAEAGEMDGKAVKGKKRKRKMLEGGALGDEEGKKRKIEDGQGGVVEGGKKRKLKDEDTSAEMKERRERLRKQKEEVRARVGIEGEVGEGEKPRKVKESKKVVEVLV